MPDTSAGLPSAARPIAAMQDWLTEQANNATGFGQVGDTYRAKLMANLCQWAANSLTEAQLASLEASLAACD